MPHIGTAGTTVGGKLTDINFSVIAGKFMLRFAPRCGTISAVRFFTWSVNSVDADGGYYLLQQIITVSILAIIGITPSLGI